VLAVVPESGVEESVLRAVEESLLHAFELKVLRTPEVAPADEDFDPQRGQCSSTAMLRRAAANGPADALRVLVVSGRDLFIPMLSFVFGQAQLGGRAAVISVARLRQAFYGLPEDEELVAERARKEALHEVGHTFGLRHCLDEDCAMSLSTDIQQVDGKQAALCASCLKLVREAKRQALRPPGGEEVRR
jgi:archaemetzincin